MKLAISLLLVGACVDSQSPSNDPATVASDLDTANGGFDTADEAPEFAAQAEFEAAAIEPDTAIADTVATPDPTTMGGHDLLLVWGKLPADPTETAKHDWTGSLTLSSGALAVQRTIAFEDSTDAVLPRTAANAVSFTSITRPFVDGLALRVLEPAGAAAPTLTYAPADGSASTVLDLSQLAAGPIVVDTADGDRMIAVGEHRDDACHHGFMRGRWHAISADLGAYLGRVTDRAGATIGHVRGIYGHKQDGSPVMFGKFIDAAGKFVGLIVGTYENGDYQAHWIDRAGDHGRLHGHYFEGTGTERGGFIGRWAESSCSDD